MMTLAYTMNIEEASSFERQVPLHQSTKRLIREDFNYSVHIILHYATEINIQVSLSVKLHTLRCKYRFKSQAGCFERACSIRPEKYRQRTSQQATSQLHKFWPLHHSRQISRLFLTVYNHSTTDNCR
jgi:hypothetical protein